MPFNSKFCLYCNAEMKVVCARDIERKKFCSHSCRMKWRFENEGWDMNILWQKNNTPEVNAKKSHKGSSHPLWLEDRSMVKFRPRYEMTSWRNEVFQRDNYTCQMCGQRGGQLSADHILPYAIYPELRWMVSNGRTLCVSCHKKTPTYGAGTRILLSIIKKQNYAVSQ